MVKPLYIAGRNTMCSHRTTGFSRSSFRRRFCTVRDEVDGHRKYDSRVFLGGYLIERLEISQLQRGFGFVDDVGGRFERLRCSLFSLGRYDLTTH